MITIKNVSCEFHLCDVNDKLPAGWKFLWIYCAAQNSDRIHNMTLKVHVNPKREFCMNSDIYTKSL